MSIKKKIAEFVKIDTEWVDKTVSTLTFDQIIQNTEFINTEFYLKGKNYELKILNNTNDYIIGLIETTNKNNIPPKKNRKLKTVSKLGLTNDEGLAYANIFLFDKHTQVLIYEVNKMGCYIDNFISFIYLVWKNVNKNIQFKLRPNTVLNKDEYNRILKMSFHKSLEMQLANPTKLLEDDKHMNESLLHICKSGKDMNSSKVFAKFEVEAKRNQQKPLSSKKISSVLKGLQKIMIGKNGENVKKVIVKGYTEDSNELTSIDLIADRMLRFIKLDEPKESNDLLEKQRKEEILRVYQECTNELNDIFS